MRSLVIVSILLLFFLLLFLFFLSCRLSIAAHPNNDTSVGVQKIAMVQKDSLNSKKGCGFKQQVQKGEGWDFWTLTKPSP